MGKLLLPIRRSLEEPVKGNLRELSRSHYIVSMAVRNFWNWVLIGLRGPILNFRSTLSWGWSWLEWKGGRMLNTQALIYCSLFFTQREHFSQAAAAGTSLP